MLTGPKTNPRKVPEWARDPVSKNATLRAVKRSKNGSLKEVCIGIGLKSCYLVGAQKGCDIMLEHNSVALQHAMLTHHRNGHIYLVDLESAHGTTLNDRKLKPLTPEGLSNKDVIRFGTSKHVFHVENLVTPPIAVVNEQMKRQQQQQNEQQATQAKPKKKAGPSSKDKSTTREIARHRTGYTAEEPPIGVDRLKKDLKALASKPTVSLIVPLLETLTAVAKRVVEAQSLGTTSQYYGDALELQGVMMSTITQASAILDEKPQARRTVWSCMYKLIGMESASCYNDAYLIAPVLSAWSKSPTQYVLPVLCLYIAISQAWLVDQSLLQPPIIDGGEPDSGRKYTIVISDDGN